MPLDTATITASYRAILRMPPDLQGFVATTYTDVDGLNGQLLVEAQDSTVPALTMFDVMFGATPAWAGGLDYLTTYVRGLETQGFSLQNVYVNLGAEMDFVALEFFPDAVGPGQQIKNVGGVFEVEQPQRFVAGNRSAV